MVRWRLAAPHAGEHHNLVDVARVHACDEVLRRYRLAEKTHRVVGMLMDVDDRETRPEHLVRRRFHHRDGLEVSQEEIYVLGTCHRV